ncbi:phospholipase D-like domain-containing protein [Roseateles sp. SL47]|uniref:phospholipase D-like domain-containing protein n=1 Tax=Roseateles sp. SL47 TaxID=2995138 RepID=UPI00226E1DB4|nr:phospholipase D-like domain-containing protein [Roseateles sp. SL47]WAC75723.1 phospholipase D-like domain-containing protein [Roseateles sp. SL47]
MSTIVFRAVFGLLLVTTLSLQPARADFSVPGFELVHTSPVETTLANPDLREPATVWVEMIDSAKRQIDFGEFYASGGGALDPVLSAMEAAGARGVKIRFLLEAKGVRMSSPQTLERLQKIPGLEFRTLDYSKVTGNGIIHAKYFVVDQREAFVGSQNFDWRSLEHIHETGLRITDATVAAGVQAIFEQDWKAQAMVAAGQPVPPLPQPSTEFDVQRPVLLLSSPRAYNPPGVGDSETVLPRLLAQARHEVRIQLLDYAPLSYAAGKRPYYGVIDEAIRAALARGVKVKLMVSDWNTEAAQLPWLKSLAVLPNMALKVVTLPQPSTGFVPFARVIHTKAMVIDDQVAWIGSSNWSGGYMDKSRNIEVVLRDAALAARLAVLHEQTWRSPYAADLDINKAYPPPAKAAPAAAPKGNGTP